MKRALLLLAFIAALSTGAFATQGFPYGSACPSGWCGIGTHIIASSINITLSDSNPSDPPIQGGTSLSDYSNLPLTIIPSQLEVRWNTDVPADGCVVYGALQNNSDRIQCEWADATHLKIGTAHHVTLKHLLPGSNGGPGNGPPTFYVTSNIDDTTGLVPNGSLFRYSPGQQAYPGPVNANGNKTAYLNVYPPNPTAALPMQWEMTSAGQVTARRGHWVDIPLNLLWLGGNATTTAGLGTCGSAQNGYLAHTYQAGQPAATNGGTYYVCNGSSWASQGSTLPAFVATSITITQLSSGNVYTCPGSASGGHDPTTHLPTTTCTGTAGDSGIALAPYYTGVVGPQSADYRNIKYSGALSAYWFDANGASVPSNAVPTSMMEFYPSASAITGAVRVNASFTVYTNESSLTTPAVGTNQIQFTYTLNVGDDSSVTQTDPSSYPVDPNMTAFWSNVSQKSVGMCSDASGNSGDSVDYFNLNLQYWMWLTFGAGDWGNFNTGNYDNSRTFLEANDLFLKQLSGTAWPNWSASASYGGSYSTMEVTPSTDTNGNTWLATVPGGVSGSSAPNWLSISSPSANTLLADGTQRWRNVGKAIYWNRCTENASVPFDNQVIQAGGSALWAQFTGAEEMHALRTNDSIIKGTSTITGFYSAAEKAQGNSDSWAGAFNPYSPGAGRGSAYQLMALATYWSRVCAQSNCSAFTGNSALTRQAVYLQNAVLNFWDIHENTNAIVSDPALTYWPTFDPLHIGVGEEAVIEWYIRDKQLDPSNSLGLLDPRLMSELKQILDFQYFSWYDQCFAAGEGAHNYSLSYNPMDVQTCAILEPYFTELLGPGAPGYDYFGRFIGNTTMSDGTTTWFQAADSMRLHSYDGRNCSNPQGNWSCQQYGIPWGGGSGSPKVYGQVGKWTIGDSWYWRTGTWTPYEDILAPQNNPCWDTGTIPCSGNHPYPDTEQPYGVQIHSNGTEQDDPTCESAYTGNVCSPIQNVTSTSANFQINIYEPVSSIRVDYGTTTACSQGSTSTEASGYPVLRNAADQLWQHLLRITGLIPNTTYYARYCATDLAGNTSCNTCTPLSGFRGAGIHFTTTGSSMLTILTTTLPNGAVNAAYNQTVQVAGGVPTYSWSISAGGLPGGLNLNPSTGAITGTPTVGGVFSFTVKVTDSASPPNTATQPLTITVSDLHVTTALLPSATSGVAYATQLLATGGLAPYTWTIQLGFLPSGLSLSSSGAITGTTTTCGTFPVVFHVADSTTPTPETATSAPLQLVVSGCGSGLSVTTSSLPNGTVNVAYNQTLHASGGTGVGYTWTVISGSLPTGLSLASGGAITGTPSASGPFTFIVQVTDSGSNHAQATLSITINSLPTITTSSLPNATLTDLYSHLVAASGGVPPYTWCVIEQNSSCDDGSGGALPAGLVITASSGLISGTPIALGTNQFTVQVTDANNSVATKVLSITVVANIPNKVIFSTGTTSIGNVTVQ